MMSQGPEPSIHEYARFYGLTRDHTELHPLQGISTSDDLPCHLDDPSNVFHIDESGATVPEERMVADTGALSLLASIAPRPPKDSTAFDEDIDLDTHRFANLKHELPLLRSDHEDDLRHWVSQVSPDLENEFLPQETVDEEADEGLTWPSWAHKMPGDIWRQVSSEKLELSHDAMVFLQQTLCLAENHTTFEEIEPSDKKVSSLAGSLPRPT